VTREIKRERERYGENEIQTKQEIERKGKER
jgi:hypothetical protein